MFYIADGRSSFYQWDTNRQLVVEDASIKEVHFCNRTGACSLVCETYTNDGVLLVNVPNIILQDDFRIKVYAYDGEATLHEACFEVNKRSKPEDYVYTETEVKRWEDKADKAYVDEKIENHTHPLAGAYTLETPFNSPESILILEGSSEDFGANFVNGEFCVGGERGSCVISVNGKVRLKVMPDNDGRIYIDDTVREYIPNGGSFEYEGEVVNGIKVVTSYGYMRFNEFVLLEDIVTDGFMSANDKKKLDNLETQVGSIDTALDEILKIQNVLIGGAN